LNKTIAHGSIAIATAILMAGCAAESQPKQSVAPSQTPPAVSNPDFEQSEALGVQLGMKSKQASRGQYEAEFIVHGPNDTKFKVKKSGKGDAWVKASFPDEFGAATEPGDYKWKCMVSGKEAVRGKFKIKSNGAPSNELKIER
jgi:hypothetical protein